MIAEANPRPGPRHGGRHRGIDGFKGHIDQVWENPHAIWALTVIAALAAMLGGSICRVQGG